MNSNYIFKIKLEIEKKFENIINDIDLVVEKLLLKLDNEKPINYESISRDANNTREKLINKINEIKNYNLNAIDREKESQIDQEPILEEKIFKNFVLISIPKQ